MTEPTGDERWTQIRYDYEHTDRPIVDICAEHGISANTLRDRVRRWGLDQAARADLPRGPAGDGDAQNRDRGRGPCSLHLSPLGRGRIATRSG